MNTPLHPPATTLEAIRHHTVVVGPLIEAGYRWRTAMPQDRHAIDHLIRKATGNPTWSITTRQHATVATLGDDTPIAAAVITVDPNSVAVTIDHIAVDVEHRGRGIATVLLHTIPHIAEEILASAPTHYAGTCPPQAATLYARCGYTVTPPGQPLTQPGTATPQHPTDPARPCWFYQHNGWR